MEFFFNNWVTTNINEYLSFVPDSQMWIAWSMIIAIVVTLGTYSIKKTADAVVYIVKHWIDLKRYARQKVDAVKTFMHVDQ